MVDIFAVVAAEKSDAEPVRRRTIPIWAEKYDWWTKAVDRRLLELGISQKQLAGYIDAGEPAVSRCINRSKPVYELLIDISDALDIPYPVILPESEQEALELAKQRRLVRRMDQVAQIAAGVPKRTKEGQIRPLSLEYVSTWKSGKKKAQEHREKPGRGSHHSR